MIDFTLYLITDRKLTGNYTLEETVEEACSAGVRAVQLREPGLDARELFELARRIHTITQNYDAFLFINDRVDVARAVGTEGVHLRESSIPISYVRQLVTPATLIGASIHSPEGAVSAQNAGADFLVYGTIFKTQSKPELQEPAGIQSITTVTKNVSIPVFAVGGITPDRTRMCIEAGAHGVAVISAIMQSTNISETVGQYKEQLVVL